MIPVSDIYGWWNVFDQSHLSSVNRLSVNQMWDRQIPKPARMTIARNLHLTVLSCKDVLEINEILVTLGLFDYQMDDPTGARRDLMDVVEAIKEDKSSPENNHRLAIARWMLGTIERDLRANQDGYQNWMKAYQLIVGVTSREKARNRADRVLWYTELLEKMRLDLVCTSEEAYEWLNFFDPKKRLSGSMRKFADTIQEEIRHYRFSDAIGTANDLIHISKGGLELDETAEVYTIAGLACQEAGNPWKALEYYAKANKAFHATSHQRAVVRWMTGIAAIEIPGEKTTAIRIWRDAIEAFRYLKKDAEAKNQADRKAWYDLKIPVLEKAIDQLMKNA